MKGNHLIETRLIGQAGLAGTGSIGRVTENLDELPPYRKESDRY